VCVLTYSRLELELSLISHLRYGMLMTISCFDLARPDTRFFLSFLLSFFQVPVYASCRLRDLQGSVRWNRDDERLLGLRELPLAGNQQIFIFFFWFGLVWFGAAYMYVCINI